MADSITVTSRKGYGSRIGDSFKAIIGGFVLIIGAVCLLWWNEQNFVKQKAALDEMNNAMVEGNSSKVSEELDGQVVYLVGKTSSPAEKLSDSAFNVETDDLKLIRKVEMYQREEDEETESTDNFGGSETTTTTYKYRKVWDEYPIDSSNFYDENGHANPTERRYESEERVKDPIYLGAYQLGIAFVNKLNNQSKISLTNQGVQLVNSTIPEEKVHIGESSVYIGKNPEQPEIGDLRISFFSVKAGDASLVGKQNGDTVTSYTASNKKILALLEDGVVDADTLFTHAYSDNQLWTWIYRVVGLLLLWCGFAALFNFIVVIAKVIPLLSNIIGAGTGLLSLCLALVVGFITIALSWLVARPLVGIILLAICAGIIAFLWHYKKNGQVVADNATSGAEDPNPSNTNNE